MWIGEEEPDAFLRVNPFSRIVFKKGEDVTVTDLEIANISDSKQTFKVKSTSNKLFDIETTVGILRVLEKVIIKVKYTDTVPPKDLEEEGDHFIQIFHYSIPKEQEDPDEAWAEAKKKTPPYQGTHRLLCCFKGWGEEDSQASSAYSDEDTDYELANGNEADEEGREGEEDDDQWEVEEAEEAAEEGDKEEWEKTAERSPESQAPTQETTKSQGVQKSD